MRNEIKRCIGDIECTSDVETATGTHLDDIGMKYGVSRLLSDFEFRVLIKNKMDGD